MVAAGVFAPGHRASSDPAGAVELVDSRCWCRPATSRRLRALPSRVGVYFVLGPRLFPGVGYPKVWDKLIALPSDTGSVPSVSGKALRDLRRRVGVAPLEALFDVGPGGAGRAADDPGRAVRPVPDGVLRLAARRSRCPTPARTGAGCWEMRAALGVTGYPAVELMTLVETGTRALLGARFCHRPLLGDPTTRSRLLARLADPTYWSWPPTASTAPRSSPSSPAPAPSSWSGCA